MLRSTAIVGLAVLATAGLSTACDSGPTTRTAVCKAHHRVMKSLNAGLVSQLTNETFHALSHLGNVAGRYEGDDRDAIRASAPDIARLGRARLISLGQIMSATSPEQQMCGESPFDGLT
jgi:hypothetical protein